MLGIPVVPISAAKNEGIDELVDHAHPCGKVSGAPRPAGFLSARTTTAARSTAASMASCHLIEDHAQRSRHPGAFCSHQAGGGRRTALRKPCSWIRTKKKCIEHIILPDGAGARAGPGRRHCGYAVLTSSTSCVAQTRCQAPSRARSSSAATASTGSSPANIRPSRPSWASWALVFYLTFGVIGARAAGPAGSGH